MSISPPNYNSIPSRKKHDIPEGVVLYSPVTEIYYKKAKGVLRKYPSYGGADRRWCVSAYSMGVKHMRKVSAKEAKGLK